MILIDPSLLVMGVVLTALVLVGLHSHGRRRRRLAEFLGGQRALDRLARADLARLGLRRSLLLGLAGVALAAAAAEPRRVDAPEPEPPVRRAIFAVDVSASMQAEDVAPTRLAGAVRAAGEILDSLDAVEVGLIAFAGIPYPLAPPTLDHDALRFLLAGIAPRLASAQDPGTVVSAAVAEAIALFERETPGSEAAPDRIEERTLVVFSDGDTGEPDDGLEDAFAAAAEAGVMLHVVGIGTEAGSGMSIPSGTYQLGGPVLDASGAPIVSRLGEPFLRGLASDGAGDYVQAGTDGGLGRLATRIRRMDAEPGVSPDEPSSVWTRYDIRLVLGMAGLVLILLESLIGVRLPHAMPARVRAREAT